MNSDCEVFPSRRRREFVTDRAGSRADRGRAVRGEDRMRNLVVRAVALFVCALTVTAMAQTGNGTLTGTVEDTSKALIPGVSITATNNETGVTTSVVTNESGGYNIPSLLPGIYKLTAELPGFQTVAYNNVELGTNESKR